MKRHSARHPSETTIELFASGRLNDRAVRRVELHLLVCDSCRARIAVEDSIREMFRVGMAEPKWVDIERGENGIGAFGRDRVEVESTGITYANHVPRMLHFRTHLPLFSLAAAAGAFSEQQAEIHPEGWVAVPSSPVLLTRDMFVTHVQGRSMEPLIPDGTLCAFRSQVAAPYEGKIVLIEDYSKAGGNRYSVKRYHASTRADPHKKSDSAWLHERITLESINPAFRPLEIPAAHKINVIGEFAFIVSYRGSGTPATESDIY